MQTRIRVLLLALCYFGLLGLVQCLRADKEVNCTAVSASGEFYDLRPLIHQVTDGEGSDYRVLGHDYGHDFLINICSPLLYNDSEAGDGSAERGSGNVGAVILDGNRTVAIGRYSNRPFFRGKRLVLEYTGGSLCPGSGRDRYRRTTTISFLCDQELYTTPAVSFVGSSNDCGFFFEWRTRAACATTNVEEDVTLGPGAVFSVICGVAFFVYMIGGIMYHRMVLKLSGWHQVPHYDTFARLRRKYRRASFNAMNDRANRLIDEADDY